MCLFIFAWLHDTYFLAGYSTAVFTKLWLWHVSSSWNWLSFVWAINQSLPHAFFHCPVVERIETLTLLMIFTLSRVVNAEDTDTFQHLYLGVGALGLSLIFHPNLMLGQTTGNPYTLDLVLVTTGKILKPTWCAGELMIVSLYWCRSRTWLCQPTFAWIHVRVDKLVTNKLAPLKLRRWWFLLNS